MPRLLRLIRLIGPIGLIVLFCTAASRASAQAPLSPTGLYATPLARTVVQLHWIDVSGDETGFRVERRVPGGTWSTVSTTAAEATVLRVTSGLAAGTAYEFRVSAVRGSEVSAPSPVAPVTMPAHDEIILDNNSPGVTVTSLVGTWDTIYLQPRDAWGSNGLVDRNTDKGQRTITYAGSVPADGSWDLYQFLPTQGSATNVPYDVTHAGGTTRVLTDQSLVDAGWAHVGRFTFAAATPFSIVLRTEGTTRAVTGDAIRLIPAVTEAPPAPGALAATPRGPGRIDLAWADSATTEHGFRVERAPAGTENWSLVRMLPPNANRTEVTGLPQLSSWRLRVRAENAAGSSAWVEAEAATTEARTRRLWVDEARLAAIRAAVAVPGSHHAQAVAAMKARVDPADWRAYDESSTDGNWNYARAWLAREAAFLYLLEGNPTHAQTAWQALRDMYDNPDPDRRWPDGGYSNGSNADLSRAATGLGFAIALDFASAGWTADQRNWARGKLENAVELWPSVSVPNATNPHISNHVGAARSAELMMILALDQEQSRPERVTQLKSWIRTHLENAYTAAGWSQEGTGYVAYAGTFLVPAILALESVGDRSLSTTLASRAFWRLPMYNFLWTANPASGSMWVLQNGVDGGAPGNQEGWASALFATVPPAMLPAYRGWYDRALGIASPLAAGRKFDFRRAGTMWSVLYYPTSGEAAPPASLLPLHLHDATGGWVMFRDRWRDEDDVQVSVFGDTRGAGNAWDAPEAMQLNVAAFGAKFIGGPGKVTTATAFSSLLIDGKNHVATTDTGSLASWTPNALGGGTAVVLGGTRTSKLGASAARREVHADFSGLGAPAVLGILDTVTSTTARTVTANFALGDEVSNHGLVARAVPAGDRAAFTVTAPSGGWMRGWVLSHADATVRLPADGSNDPIQVETSGTAVDLLLVLAFGKGTPPVGSITGLGKDAVLALPGARVRYDAARPGFVVENVPASPYLAWLESTFGPGAAPEPSADADRDGIPNLLAYALGADLPGGVAAARPAPAVRELPGGGTEIALRWIRPDRPGVTLRAETAPTPAGPWSPATIATVSSGPEGVTEEVVLPSTGGFARLVASQD